MQAFSGCQVATSNTSHTRAHFSMDYSYNSLV